MVIHPDFAVLIGLLLAAGLLVFIMHSVGWLFGFGARGLLRLLGYMAEVSND